MQHFILAIFMLVTASLYAQQGIIPVKDKALKIELKTLKNDTIKLKEDIYFVTPVLPYKFKNEVIVVKLKNNMAYFKSVGKWHSFPYKKEE